MKQDTRAITSVYDDLAPDYDARYNTPEARWENAQLARWLDHPTLPQDHVLDIGCGTGLLLDLLAPTVPPEHYTGMDPSVRMARELVRKHPRYEDRVTIMPYRAYRRFDLVVAAFGAASYLEPRDIETIPDVIAPSGRALLMFYRPGYLPNYDLAVLEPLDVLAARDTAVSLPRARHVQWRNFTVVTL